MIRAGGEAAAWAVGALAWWTVRDPLLTPRHPYRVAVVVLGVTAKRVRVRVVEERSTVVDRDRRPGYTATVDPAKLAPRVPR